MAWCRRRLFGKRVEAEGLDEFYVHGRKGIETERLEPSNAVRRRDPSGEALQDFGDGRDADELGRRQDAVDWLAAQTVEVQE